VSLLFRRSAFRALILLFERAKVYEEAGQRLGFPSAHVARLIFGNNGMWSMIDKTSAHV